METATRTGIDCAHARYGVPVRHAKCAGTKPGADKAIVHATLAQCALSLRAQPSVKRDFSRCCRMAQRIVMRSTTLVLAASTASMLAAAGVLAAEANDALNGPPAAISLNRAALLPSSM